MIFRAERVMFRVFLELALVIIIFGWVLAEAFSALGRWLDEHPNSKLARDAQMDPPKRRFRDLDYGSLGLALAMSVVLALGVPSAVSSGGRSTSLNDITDSIRTSLDFDRVATFVQEWRAEQPLQFLAFLVALLIALLWLVTRSPLLWVLAVVAAGTILWLRMKV